jgi:hypothetical protein
VNSSMLPTRSAQVKNIFHLMDDILAEAKAAAAVQVSKELRADLYRKMPVFVRRLKRTFPKDPARCAINAALLSTLNGDRKLAARFFLRVIATQHLWRRYIHPEIAKEVDARGVVFVPEVVDDILEACVVAITAYPHDCQPRLPRRCDVARAVHRRCRNGR